MNRYRLAIFDMDGTILNTLTDIANAINHTLQVFNKPTRDIEEIRMFVGNGLRKLVERAFPEDTDSETLEAAFKELLAYYGEHSSENTSPYEGINETISRLKSLGISTAVVSNKADFAVQKLAQEFFDGLFDYAIGEHTGFAPKPAPDMVDEILRRADISRDESVYIGDSDVDLQTAANSNMDCIAVSWGFRSKDFLKAHGATVIADSPDDLYEQFVN